MIDDDFKVNCLYVMLAVIMTAAFIGMVVMLLIGE